MVDNTLDQEEKNLHFQEACKELLAIYSVKNVRYNDSFSKQFKMDGMLSPLTRLRDKFNRFEYLARHPEDGGDDETILDTLQDLASYTIMTIMELDKHLYRGE